MTKKKEKAAPKPKATKTAKAKPAKKAWAFMIGNEGPYGIDYAKEYAKKNKRDLTNAKHLKALFMSKVEAKPGEKCAATGVALIPGEPDGAAPIQGDHINRKTYDKQMRRGLEGQDQVDAIAELGLADQDLKVQMENRAKVMAEWKAIVSQAEERLDAAVKTVTHGRLEVVRVEETKNFTQGTFRLARVEDGKVLEDRALTDADGQPELMGLDAESPASQEAEEAKPYDKGDAIDGTGKSTPGFDLAEGHESDDHKN